MRWAGLLIICLAAMLAFSVVEPCGGVRMAYAEPYSACFCDSGIGALTDGNQARLSVRHSLDRAEGADLVAELIEELGKLLPDDIPKDPGELGSALSAAGIFEDIAGWLTASCSELVSFFMLLIGLCVIFAVSEEALSRMSSGARGALSMVICAPVALRIVPYLERACESISSGGAFFGGVIPIVCAVSAAAGMGSTAAAGAAGMNLSLGLVSGFTVSVLMPLLSVFAALSFVNCASDSKNADSLCRSVKGLFTFSQGLVTTVILSGSALQSAVTAAVDGMSMRGLKCAISGMIPVVGSTVSSSLSFLTSGAVYASKYIGAASVLAIGSIFGSLLVELLLLRLCISLARSFAGLISSTVCERALGLNMAVLDAIISVYVSVALLYALQIVIFLGCVGRAYT